MVKFNDKGLKVCVIGVAGEWSSEKLADAFAAKTGIRLLVSPDRLTGDLATGRVHAGGHYLDEVEAVVIKKAGLDYSPKLQDRLNLLGHAHEVCGVPIFSSPRKISAVVNRLDNTLKLREAAIPMPATTITEEIDEALKAVGKYGRAILKPLYSTKARGMVSVESGPKAREAVARFAESNPVIYVQQQIEHMGRDISLAFLSGEYVATYARVGSDSSWNTTIRSGGSYRPHEPSGEVLELARKAAHLFDLDFTTVDVVETPDGPMLFEVSAFGGYRGLQEAHGIDMASLIADYVLEKFRS